MTGRLHRVSPEPLSSSVCKTNTSMAAAIGADVCATSVCLYLSVCLCVCVCGHVWVCTVCLCVYVCIRAHLNQLCKSCATSQNLSDEDMICFIQILHRGQA